MTYAYSFLFIYLPLTHSSSLDTFLLCIEYHSIWLTFLCMSSCMSTLSVLAVLLNVHHLGNYSITFSLCSFWFTENFNTQYSKHYFSFLYHSVFTLGMSFNHSLLILCTGYAYLILMIIFVIFLLDVIV